MSLTVNEHRLKLFFRNNTRSRGNANRASTANMRNVGRKMKMNVCIVQRDNVCQLTKSLQNETWAQDWRNLLPNSLWLKICLKRIILYNKMKLEINYVIYLCVPALIFDFRVEVLVHLPARITHTNEPNETGMAIYRRCRVHARCKTSGVLIRSHQTWHAYSSWVFVRFFFSLLLCVARRDGKISGKKYVCCDRVHFQIKKNKKIIVKRNGELWSGIVRKKRTRKKIGMRWRRNRRK